MSSGLTVEDVFHAYYRVPPHERYGGAWLLGFDAFDEIVGLAGAHWVPLDDLLLLGMPVSLTLTPGVFRFRPACDIEAVVVGLGESGNR